MTLALILLAVVALAVVLTALGVWNDWRRGIVVIPIGPETNLVCHVTPRGKDQAREAWEVYRAWRNAGGVNEYTSQP